MFFCSRKLQSILVHSKAAKTSDFPSDLKAWNVLSDPFKMLINACFDASSSLGPLKYLYRLLFPSQLYFKHWAAEKATTLTHQRVLFNR